MASVRNTVDRIGTGNPDPKTYLIDGVTITYDATLAGGTAAVNIGKAVSLSADGTVQLASDGEAIVGQLILVESDSKCHVQTHGTVFFPGGAAAALTRGKTIVGAVGAAAAKGYIREAASGTAAELVLARGQIIASGTATAVEVNL